MSQPETLGTPHPLSAARAPLEMHQLDSQMLFGTARELLIRHNGAVYRLRMTRAGKLILTK